MKKSRKLLWQGHFFLYTSDSKTQQKPFEAKPFLAIRHAMKETESSTLTTTEASQLSVPPQCTVE